MWKLERDRGSITVEMCFVMPIVIGVVMMLVSLVIRCVNEGSAIGTAQLAVYAFDYLEEGQGNESEGYRQGELIMDNHQLLCKVNLESKGKMYDTVEVTCRKEWNMCTDRLRRWQLYGDKLWE